MKLHPEDPRLTAFLLGELSADDAASVERAVADAPALQAEIREMQGLQTLLTEGLAVPQAELLAHQRDAILRTAREADRAAKASPFAAMAEVMKAMFIPACAAAVLALTTYILLRMPQGDQNPVAEKHPTSAPPAVPAAPSISPAPTPIALPSVRQGSVAAVAFPTLDLPIQAGKSNLETISNSIRNDHQLPSHESVRLEEILNGFPLRLIGTTAIARSGANHWHPDNRDSGVSSYVATLSTEMIACPWKPSATLLLISLRGNALTDCDVKLSFHTNPENVFHYRFLGFAPGAGHIEGSLPTKLPANASATLAIEIEPAQPASELGTLEWSTDGKPAPVISLVHKSDAEPSDDARFAALVCAYAQWLAGEQPGIIDAEIVSGLAREIATTTLPADRADFLNLIDKTLHL